MPNYGAIEFNSWKLLGEWKTMNRIRVAKEEIATLAKAGRLDLAEDRMQHLA